MAGIITKTVRPSLLLASKHKFGKLCLVGSPISCFMILVKTFSKRLLHFNLTFVIVLSVAIYNDLTSCSCFFLVN